MVAKRDGLTPTGLAEGLGAVKDAIAGALDFSSPAALYGPAPTDGADDADGWLDPSATLYGPALYVGADDAPTETFEVVAGLYGPAPDYSLDTSVAVMYGPPPADGEDWVDPFATLYGPEPDWDDDGSFDVPADLYGPAPDFYDEGRPNDARDEADPDLAQTNHRPNSIKDIWRVWREMRENG